MNKVILVGNLARDPELRQTASGTSVASFTIAVTRRFKNQNGEFDADFINCVAWRATAEFVCKYFGKGKRIGVVGSLQTRSYDDREGNKRYVTEVIVDEAEFVAPKGSDGGGGSRDDYGFPQEPPADYNARGNTGGNFGAAPAQSAPQLPKANDTGFDEFEMDETEIPF